MNESSPADPNGSAFIDPEQWGEPAGMSRRKKTGGRQRGTPNKKTTERAKLLGALKVDGKDPFSFFSSILKNEDAPFDLRLIAAKELLPYSHPKLSSIEARTGGMTHEDRLEQLQAMLGRSKAAADVEGQIADEGGAVKRQAEAGAGVGPQRKRITPRVWSISDHLPTSVCFRGRLAMARA